MSSRRPKLLIVLDQQIFDARRAVEAAQGQLDTLLNVRLAFEKVRDGRQVSTKPKRKLAAAPPLPMERQG